MPCFIRFLKSITERAPLMPKFHAIFPRHFGSTVVKMRLEREKIMGQLEIRCAEQVSALNFVSASLPVESLARDGTYFDFASMAFISDTVSWLSASHDLKSSLSLNPSLGIMKASLVTN